MDDLTCLINAVGTAVGGHGFSRAVVMAKTRGFSRWGFVILVIEHRLSI
jgi:hypothetical protein